MHDVGTGIAKIIQPTLDLFEYAILKSAFGYNHMEGKITKM